MIREDYNGSRSQDGIVSRMFEAFDNGEEFLVSLKLAGVGESNTRQDGVSLQYAQCSSASGRPIKFHILEEELGKRKCEIRKG
jgi:hypothetical protein